MHTAIDYLEYQGLISKKTKIHEKFKLDKITGKIKVNTAIYYAKFACFYGKTELLNTVLNFANNNECENAEKIWYYYAKAGWLTRQVNLFYKIPIFLGLLRFGKMSKIRKFLKLAAINLGEMLQNKTKILLAAARGGSFEVLFYFVTALAVEPHSELPEQIYYKSCRSGKSEAVLFWDFKFEQVNTNVKKTLGTMGVMVSGLDTETIRSTKYRYYVEEVALAAAKTGNYFMFKNYLHFCKQLELCFTILCKKNHKRLIIKFLKKNTDYIAVGLKAAREKEHLDLVEFLLNF